MVIPIHNADGALVAYCGRYPSNTIPEDEAKYRKPPNFHKELELYNWHRCKALFADGTASTLVLVESFFSVFHSHEAFRVCALMGLSLSEAQLTIIAMGHVKRVVLLLDGDQPGRDAIAPMAGALASENIAVYAPQVPADFKPHCTPIEELRQLIRPLL